MGGQGRHPRRESPEQITATAESSHRSVCRRVPERAGRKPELCSRRKKGCAAQNMTASVISHLESTPR